METIQLPEEFRLPQDAHTSLMVPIPRGDVIWDAVFYYREDGTPLLRLAREPESGAVMWYEWLAEDTPAAFSPPEPTDLSKEQYAEAYEQAREIFFREELTEADQAVRAGMGELFLALTPSCHLPAYRNLSPEFCGWIGLAEESPEPDTPQPSETEQAILARLQSLSDRFEEKIRVDAKKERLFDEMHEELQAYKNDLLDRLTRPMEEDIIRQVEEIEKTMDLFRQRPYNPDNYRRLFALFEGVRTDLADLLYRYGIEAFSSEEDAVCVSRQKILSTVSTDDPALDKRIATRHGMGWEKNGKILRPQRVSVYLYQDQAQSSNQEE